MKVRVRTTLRPKRVGLGFTQNTVSLMTLACIGIFPIYAAATPVTAETVSSADRMKLLPYPREARKTGSLSLAHGVVVHLDANEAGDRFAAQDLRDALQTRKILTDSTKYEPVVIELMHQDTIKARALLSRAEVTFQDAMEEEGYVIVPQKHGLAIIAATDDGLFYGVQTVKQLVVGTGNNASLNQALIRDWPAMRYRGMSDDLSRGPIATLDYQKQQIRTFAAYKLNVYSPYFENTLQYSSNPIAAQPGGAMRLDDLKQLIAYAKPYHIMIVPEQESFGHLHNLLNREIYSGLAETPHGSVLAPGDPDAIPLIQQWFKEIAEVTPGPFLHIGADETFELGKGRTRKEVQRRGLGPVYIDFLTKMDQALKPLHKQLLFWGDVATNEPELVTKLPKDMIAVPWVYDPEPAGFDRYILPFQKAGMETWVAPSVNNWNRIYPDTMRGLLDIQGFVRDGQRLGSTGTLNTAWNDDGEGLFDLDWCGVVFGATAGWQQGESSIGEFLQSYGTVFYGDTTGKIDQAQRELMEAQTLLKGDPNEGSTDHLYWMDPWSPEGQAEARTLRPILHDLRIHAETALILIAEAHKASPLREQSALAAMELGARRLDSIGMKFQLSDEMIASYAKAYVAAKNGAVPSDEVDSYLYEIADTNGRCQDIRNEYALHRELYKQAWNRENRPFALQNVMGRYDLAIQLWITRGNLVASAMDSWHRTHMLPPAEQLGIPLPAQ